MRIIETKVFLFSELNDAAKERARDVFRDSFTYPWEDDAIKSLEAFAKRFPFQTRFGYEIDFYGCMMSTWSGHITDLDADAGETLHTVLRGMFSDADLSGNCPLTGYCADEDLLDAVRDALKGPDTSDARDLRDVFDAAFRSLVKSCQSDVEYHLTDAAIDEHIVENGWEFTENGKLI